MITLSEAKAIYKTGGGHFFDRETFKYWVLVLNPVYIKIVVLLPVKTILTEAAELTPCAGSLLTSCTLKLWENFSSTHLKKPPEKQQRRPKP